MPDQYAGVRSVTLHLFRKVTVPVVVDVTRVRGTVAVKVKTTLVLCKSLFVDVTMMEPSAPMEYIDSS